MISAEPCSLIFTRNRFTIYALWMEVESRLDLTSEFQALLALRPPE